MKQLLNLFALLVLLASFNLSATEMKEIDFTKTYEPQISDISELELTSGKSLPDWYASYYMKLSGLKRADVDGDESVDFVAKFEDGGTNGDHIVDFLTADQIKQQWPYIDYLEEYIENFEISGAYVEWEHLFPLAGTGDGTLYLAISGKHERAIFEADNGDYGIGRVADDIDEFLSSLGLLVDAE